jgi:hypothetical protein
MDRKKLESQLNSFKEKCRKAGFIVENIITNEVYTDASDFSVDVCISNLTEDNVLSFRDETFKIFMDTLTPEFLDFVLTYCVIDSNIVECCDAQKELTAAE